MSTFCFFFQGKRWKHEFLFQNDLTTNAIISRNHSNGFSPNLCQNLCKGYAYSYWKWIKKNLTGRRVASTSLSIWKHHDAKQRPSLKPPTLRPPDWTFDDHYSTTTPHLEAGLQAFACLTTIVFLSTFWWETKVMQTKWLLFKSVW